MRRTAAAVLGVLLSLAAADAAHGSTLVYVCGRDLCTSATAAATVSA